MSKAVVKYIPVDVYKRGIYVLIGSLKDLKYFVEKEYTADEQTEFLEMVLNLKEENIGMASFNYDSEGGGIVLIPKEPKTPVEVAALVHELLHATFHILNYCNFFKIIVYKYSHEYLIVLSTSWSFKQKKANDL